MSELKNDVAAYYEWAEKQEDPGVHYGVSFHLFQVQSAIDQLNSYIQRNITGKAPKNQKP